MEVFENSTVSGTLNDPEDGQITFKSSDESVATVDDNGHIHAVGEGVAIITLSYAGCEDYLPSQASVTVRVSAIPTSINVIGFTPVIKGQSLYLNGSLTPNVGELVYTSGDSSIAYVDSSTGRITDKRTKRGSGPRAGSETRRPESRPTGGSDRSTSRQRDGLQACALLSDSLLI